MNTKPMKMVRPDAKGRVTLGSLAKGISSFAVIQDKDSKIILIPHVEIPAKEKWLFENKDALAKVKQGLVDSATKRVRAKGSFKKHLDDEIE